MSNLSYVIILTTDYELYPFFWLYEYFVASARALIVKGALVHEFNVHVHCLTEGEGEDDYQTVSHNHNIY